MRRSSATQLAAVGGGQRRGRRLERLRRPR